MTSRKKKLIAIVGPTASGKSDLAVFLAKKFGGEIISADSRQVYRGLDIGTNKVHGSWQKADSKGQSVFMYKDIPHHCIDFVDPKEVCTVTDFKKCADTAIKNITERGKISFLVGGTGFYIDAVVYGIILPEVPPHKKLREELSHKTTGELFTLLKKLDPTRAETIDPDNPRRLVRAIEIATVLGSVPVIEKRPVYNTLLLGIKRSEEEIKERITVMVRTMLKNGLIGEAQNLIKSGMPQKRIRELGFEYSYAVAYLQSTIRGSASIDNLEKILIQKNWQYAKRQMTWFKRDKHIQWISSREEAEGILKAL